MREEMRKDFQVLIPFRGDRDKSTSSVISLNLTIIIVCSGEEFSGWLLLQEKEYQQLYHGQLGISLAFPPFDVGGGDFTTVLEVAYVD
jgi:hypothetical protein